MDFNNNVRLEIEVPTEGLPNLVQNPSGELGSWGWVTPVANTRMAWGQDGNGYSLIYENLATQASYFTTEHMPVAAGKYVGGRFDLTYIAYAGYNVKARFEFYDANKTLITTSAQTAALTTLQTHYIPAVQAPTNTAYVKLRFDFYNGSGGNPVNGSQVFFRNAMVTYADTNAGLGSSRTNLVPNPSFESSVVNWEGYPNYGDIMRSTVVGGYSGTASMRVKTLYASTYGGLARSYYIDVQGGNTYTASGYFRADSIGREVRMGVQWKKADGSETGVYVGAAVNDVVGSWKRAYITITAPSDAVQARVYTFIDGSAVNEYHYVDAVMLEASKTLGTYIEGTVTTASGAYDFSEPYDWRNILGPTHEISIERKAMDVGLLSAQINDALLDPAVTDVIRPGKRIRLMAEVDGKWNPIYTGTVSNVPVKYPREKRVGSKVETRIELTASDAIAHLANQGENRGIASINDLPFILEGKGAPWNVNGSGNQVASATVVSHNENASVLDQVAVTRDTNLGYAWVGKDNVLNVFDSDQMPGTGVVAFVDRDFVFTDKSYTFEVDAEGFDSGVRSTAQFRSGAASFLTNAGDNSAIGPLLPVDPGVTYTVKGYNKNASADYYTDVGFNWYDKNNQYITYTYAGGGTTTTTAWREAVHTQAAPDNAAYVRVHLYQSTTDTTNQTYWDDITVTSSLSGLPKASYTSIDVDFNVDTAINQVTVNWLRYDIGADSTTEIPYGPYQDAASVAKWGARAATFTIQGATESASDIAAYAQNILTKNATPVVRCNSLTMPVRNEDELSIATALDLYSLVAVHYDTKVNADYRVTGLTHRITPDKWLVDLSFETDGSVASPTWVPSPPFSGLSSAGGSTSGVVQMYAGNSIPSGWLLCNGQALSASEYSGLFNAIGYTYGGSGDTFYVPNLVQKFPLGGNGSDAGASGGSKKITTSNMPSHSHTINHDHGNVGGGNHDHNFRYGTGSGANFNQYAPGNAFSGTSNQIIVLNEGAHSHNVPSYSGSSGSAGSGTDYMPPYVTMNFIIKA